MKIEDIEKLCDEATCGPWFLNMSSEQFIEDGNEHTFYCVEITGPNQFNTKFAINDAKFIGASRTLMPKLLAVAKAAKIVDICRKYPGDMGVIYPELEKALKELEK